MRTFYREYKEQPILQPLAAEIAWTKNTLILDRCQNSLQREFYLRASARFGWTRRVLAHQIDNQTYEKYLLNQTSFDNALPQAVAAQAKLAVKDHYTFDFLELSEAHEERELETALIANVQRFLTGMGPHFTSVGSQYRLNVEGTLPRLVGKPSQNRGLSLFSLSLHHHGLTWDNSRFSVSRKSLL
jgi:predicted nuclease of restriction endonuclease-like (RecB) superfamily